MKPSPDGSLCPIKITGENCLNYDIIITFMCVKKKAILLDNDCVEHYAKKTKNKTAIGDDHFHEEKVKVLIQQSLSSYEHIRSFIGYMFKVNRVTWSQDDRDKFSIFIAEKKDKFDKKSKT